MTRARVAFIGGLSSLCFLVLLPLTHTEVQSANDASRFGAAFTLAATGEWGLLPQFGWTVDRALRDDGVVISDKPPLLSLLATELMRGANALGVSLDNLYRLCVIVLSLLPAALTIALLGFGLQALGGCGRGMTALTMALMAATSLLAPYALTFSNHALAALAVMAMTLLLMRPPEAAGAMMGFALGLTAGLLLSIDVPVGLVLVPLAAAFVLWRFRRAVPMFLIGLCIALAAGLALNSLTTHRLLPIYFQGDMYEYEGSVWAELPEDLPAYPVRVIQRLVVMTVGYQGIAVMWPVGLFAALGLWRALRGGEDSPRRAVALWVVLAWVLVMGALILNPSARGGDLRGGFGYGLRWVVPLLAPLALFLPGGIRGLRMRGRIALAMAALWGVIVVTLGVVNPWPSNTVSVFPPLHNAAVLAAKLQPDSNAFPDAVVRWTSREPALGHFDLGMVHYQAGRHANAVGEFERALEEAERGPVIQSDPVLMLYHLAHSLSELRLFAPADAAYRKLLAMDPNNVGARNNWSLMLLNVGHPERALRQAEESIVRDPNSPTARLAQVMALLALGERDRAREAAVTAVKDGATDGRMQALMQETGL